VHYAADPGGALFLNESFPEIPRPPSMLTVCTFKRMEIEAFDNESTPDKREAATDEAGQGTECELLQKETIPLICEPLTYVRWQKKGQIYRNYVVKAAFSITLAPRGYAEVKLGVSLQAPAGTYMVIAPVTNGYNNQWELGDHRLDADRNGEAMARIVNCTDQRVVITTGTTIGQLHVLRIKVNVNRTVSQKEDDKTLLKMTLPKDSLKRTKPTLEKWEEKIQGEDDLSREREKIAEIQDSILGKENRPKILHLCDNDE